jgi:hypothetical protein
MTGNMGAMDKSQEESGKAENRSDMEAICTQRFKAIHH